jgi:16S rRNA (guanine527-N7)-methyltransferase
MSLSKSRAKYQEDVDQFEALALQHRLRVNSTLIKELVKYRDLVVDWNDRVRLVSRSDGSRVLRRHVFESLLLVRHLEADCSRLADIGTGGGFPGVPLCLAEERLTVSLIESARMKTLFLKEVAKALSPNRIEVIHDRAEQVAQTRGGTFDVVTSRAVGSLEHVWNLAKPLLKPQGYLLAPKGPGEAEADLGPLGIEFKEEHVELEDRTMTIVTVRKQ